MRYLILSLIPWTFFSCAQLAAQCGQTNWVLTNDCGDIQAFGGLAPNQPTIFCAGEVVNVENNSSPATEITMTYIDWDDGICESFQGMPLSFSHVYTFPTDTCYNGGLVTFMVRMGVEKDCGSDKSFNFITFPVAVRFKPLVIINTSNLISCTGTEIDFSSEVCANGVLQYQWIIGSDTLTGPNVPGYVFDNPGEYDVSLTVINSCGQGGTAVSVSSLGPASASAAASVSDVCAPDTVFFSNQSANAIGQSWEISPPTGWSYVNGTNSLSAEPAIAFTQPGSYAVRLLVEGCGSPEWRDTITVLERPGASLPAIPDVCDTGPFLYVPTAGISGSQPVVSWEFQGGQPATGSGPAPDTVLFSGVGEYVVRVTATVPGCGSASASDTFRITSLPEITLTPVPDVCNSAPPFQLSAVPAGNGWSGPGVSPEGMFDPGAIPDSLLNEPLALFFQTGSGDCLVRDTLVVRVNGVPVDAGPGLSRCLNAGSVALSAEPSGGVWTGPGVGATGLFDPSLAGVGQHILAYAATEVVSQCVSVDTLLATVLSLPEAGLDSAGVVCAGAPFVFSGTGGGVCRWDFGDGSTSDSCMVQHIYAVPGLYTLRLAVENAAGCRDTAVAGVEVMPPPSAAFVADLTEGCADLTVNIVNQSALNGAVFVWDFGNGRRDTTDQPGPVVFGTGLFDTTYTVVMQALSACGTATQEQTITVYPLPQADFGTNISNGCSPMEVGFSNTSVGEPDFFQWYINGEAAGTGFLPPPQVFYATVKDSLHYITLVAGNECGLDTVTRTVLVKPNTVTAFFHIDTLSGCQPLAVQLTDFSTVGAGISWSLGDGNMAVGDTVNHVYEQPGEYLIRSFAGNGCGSDTATATVKVWPSPVASFEHAPFGCQGDTLQLTNTSPNLAGSIWDFGDGTGDSTRTSPGHVYADTGVYVITLTVTSDAHACTASTSRIIEVKPLPAPSAVVTDSFGCQPFVFEALNTSSGPGFFVWDFGDGNFSTAETPVHTYLEAGAYMVTLEMTDLYGCRNAWSYKPVNVFPRPQAQFVHDEAGMCVTPAVLELENLSVDADSYLWDFGQYGGSALTHPRISIPEPAVLRVGLVASNAFGCRDTTVRDIRVYTAPVLDFFIEDARGCSPLAVLFENASFGVNQYAWDFGDGGVSDEAEPLHVYEQPGVYGVTLYASADSVCFDSLRLHSLVEVLPTPVAGFTYEELSDTSVTPNGILRFFDQSIAATRWFWDFGDGDSSRLQDPVHRYAENGPKVVTLVVGNGTGCADTAVVEILPEVFGSLYIPNALSPDAGDPGVRYFRPVGAGLEAYEVSVFASNGQRVWHSTRLERGSPTEFWDGTFNGSPLPQGVYWWKARGRYVDGRLWRGMSYDSEPPAREGKVMLLR